MAFKLNYLLILFAVTGISYGAGLAIYRAKGKHTRLAFLTLSLCLNLMILCIFKYLRFFFSIIGEVLEVLNVQMGVPDIDLVLPIGISFFTFQAMSYTIEIFRNRQVPEAHLGRYALYVSFFPQLVAGPIERSYRLLPQFLEKKEFDYERIISGLLLMLWGFFKKIVIADNLGAVVNRVYNNPYEFGGLYYAIATVLFSYQIYCDFSGYSDIAIGAARIMGFNLTVNFKRPYYSKSVVEFWKRWHISLSSWFRDYVYFPLGGNRVPCSRWILNIFIVFLLSGLWHGADWTFLMWGALHGTYVVVTKLMENTGVKLLKLMGVRHNTALHNIVRVVLTNTLICFAWIFFRANSIREAFYIVGQLFVGEDAVSLRLAYELLFRLNDSVIHEILVRLDLNAGRTVTLVLSIAFLETVHLLSRKHNLFMFIRSRPMWMRWGLYVSMVLIILLLGKYSKLEPIQEFIYFQF
jgi:D-alanyl-lipoteichoic acid acyltransferase DltB (MBOAT superfamily)